VAVSDVFTAIPVADFGAARDWYERLLGRPADLIPNENEAAWQLAEKAWIYVIGDAGRAGGTMLTILVDDLEAHVATLSARGVATAAIETLSYAKRLLVTDPDGNRLTFAQPTPT
jgi:hypothetical protein